VTEKSIITQFERFLRQFFPSGQFRLLVQQWPHLRAVATAISDAQDTDDTAPYVDLKSLANSLEGVVISRGQADQRITVIEGQFNGHKAKLTLVMPLVVPA
jgi:hypothetical protein